MFPSIIIQYNVTPIKFGLCVNKPIVIRSKSFSLESRVK